MYDPLQELKERALPEDGRTHYFRADHSTLGTAFGPQIPWWLCEADQEVDGLCKAIVALTDRLEIEGFVGHEECAMPGEPKWPDGACVVCKAITLAHAIKAESGAKR